MRTKEEVQDWLLKYKIVDANLNRIGVWLKKYYSDVVFVSNPDGLRVGFHELKNFVNSK